MMLRRFLAALAGVLAVAEPAVAADNNFATPGNATAQGMVNMCLNASGQAVACSATSPLPVAGSSQPSGATAITASSGNVTAAVATATLAAVAGKTTYITGFQMTAGGSTAVSTVTCTVSGVITGTMSYSFSTAATVDAPSPPLTVSFVPPVPASATNTPIVASCPALGAGNAHATMSAQGYQL